MIEDTTTPGSNPEVPRILLVDDNVTNLRVLSQTLENQGFELLAARDGETALEVARKARPDLVLLDIMMPKMDGFEVCRQLKADEATRGADVIFLSALGESSDKVRGLELGAVDYISKPFQRDEVLARVQTHLTIHRLRGELHNRNRRLEHELRVAQELLRDARIRVDGALLGDSEPIKDLRAAITAAAADSRPVLLTGPPGAGQEAVARAIHRESGRSSRVFLSVNCAALLSTTRSDTSTAGTHERTADHEGPKWALAHEGTLYLEAINALPHDAQRELVAHLRRLSAPDAISEPAFRLIAYSPRPLEDCVRAGEFRRDLLELLTVGELRVPSLAERTDDIPILASYFVAQHALRLSKAVDGLSDRSVQRMRAYPWPGNVNELRSALEQAVVVSDGPLVEVDTNTLTRGVPMGHYRLTERIKSGGMGEVWRARHQFLARPAAVKLIRADFLHDTQKGRPLVERFRREAEVTANLRSPHTVQLYDFGLSETGAFYYVMELLDGMDLERIVKQFGPLPPERVVMLLRQACRSLSEAHGVGLVHRDIKPANLYACRLGEELDFLKVLDFGIVKEGQAPEEDAITGGDRIAGTPAYMAPEQLLGESDVDSRADIYSLGSVAFWMLTGKRLYTGPLMKVMNDILRSEPRAPSTAAPSAIPEALDRLVLACVSSSPGERPGTAGELERELAAIDLEPPWTQERAESWWQTNASAVEDAEAPPSQQ